MNTQTSSSSGSGNTVTIHADFFTQEKAKAEQSAKELEKQIADIEREAAHRVMPLKWDLAAAKSKIKKLEKEIAGK